MSHKILEQLWMHDRQGGARLASSEEILKAAREVLSRKVRRGTSMSSPQLVQDFLAVKLGNLEHEMFCVLFLDLCGAGIYVHAPAGAAEIT
jgi:DNA repair protein RadC